MPAANPVLVAPGHVPNHPCDHCGELDADPSLHYGPATYHHDCVPAPVKAEIEAYAAEGSASAKNVLLIIAEAESGTRGADLAAFINSLHPDTPEA